MAKRKDPRETGAVPAARTAGDGIDRASTASKDWMTFWGADSPVVDCISSKAPQAPARPSSHCCFCSLAARVTRAAC
jgi:hypothetical protein